MSVVVLLLSLVSAIVQGGTAWFLLENFPRLPGPLVIGIVFAVGILLSFLLVIFIGSVKLTRFAADFVRDSMGKVLALMLACMLAVGALAAGAEWVYELHPNRDGGSRSESREPDLLFVLDYSSSMDTFIPGEEEATRADGLKEAFIGLLGDLSDERCLSIICYESTPELTMDWSKLDALNREEATRLVGENKPNGGTNFNAALAMADEQVKKALQSGRAPVVIMISDGEDSVKDVSQTAPTIVGSSVPVYTMGIGDDQSFSSLESISTQTGGTMLVSAEELTAISSGLRQVVSSAMVTDDEAGDMRDTLLYSAIVRQQDNRGRIVKAALLLFLVSCAFRLVVNNIMGNNARNWLPHLLSMLMLSALGVAAMFLPGWMSPNLHPGSFYLVTICYWPLMMMQVVLKKR